MNEAVRQRYPEVWRKHTPRETAVHWIWIVAVALASVWSVSALEIEWVFFKDAHLQAADLASKGVFDAGLTARLHVAIHTVKSHVRNVMEKLTLHSRLQIAAYVHAESRK